jgi:hypothetical protein
MKSVLQKSALALILAASLSGHARAKTIKLPDESSVATVMIPDSWKPEEIEDGIQAQSPDASVYLSIEVGDVGNLNDLIDNTFSYLKKNKVRIDDSTKKESDVTLNGLSVKDITWTGRDADGPTVVGVSFITVNPEKVLVLTHWASPDGEKKYDEAIAAMMKSIKAR